MNQMQLTLVISYLLMTCYFLSNWVRFSLRHPTSTPEDKFLSFVMCLITTIFWPLIVPISCLDMLKNHKLEFSSVIPVLLAIFALSISFYLSYLHEHGFCYYGYHDLLCPSASETRDDASSSTALEAVEKATGVFFTGADQARITSILKDTELDTAIHKRFLSGIVVAGTSAVSPLWMSQRLHITI